MSTQISIDGSLGEGGGQILRTALALSMTSGQPFRIEKIRAGRPKPGLLRQHLTAVNAAAAVCGATVEGAAIQSQSLSFSPGKVKPGEYTFSIGSAGSTTLVLQTVLPALLTASGPSSLTLEGGTHNPHAPPIDFLEKAFLPLINRMGPTVNVTLERAGFYPAGGGRVFANIIPATKTSIPNSSHAGSCGTGSGSARPGVADTSTSETPSTLTPITILERGPIHRRLALAVVSALPGAIAKRELERVQQSLGWSDSELQIRQLPSEWGPGNAVTLEIASEHVTEVFTGFGMKGVSAEAVAESVIQPARRYLADGAPIGAHLADQLLLPLALAGGGAFRTQAPTRHTMTNIEIIRKFLSVRIDAAQYRSRVLRH